MKIDNTLKSVVAPRGKDGKSDKSRTPLVSSEQAAVSDSVRLTATAEKMRELEPALGEIDITDSGKIETIRQAIADGSFTVDEEAVAEGLIQSSIDTLTHRPEQ